MKNYVLLCLHFILVVNLSSQTAIKDHPGQIYFDLLEKIILEKKIQEK
jgi:hypothetical protein